MELVSRETYKKVKRMNRTEMNDFLNKIYAMGENSVEGATFEKVIKIISELPGIGDKRLQQIADALAPLYVNGSEENEEE